MSDTTEHEHDGEAFTRHREAQRRPYRHAARVHYLYKITAPDGRAYIGVAKDTGKRFHEHCRAKTQIGEAIREFGRANMRFEVIDIGERVHIYQREVETIAALNTRLPNGFNVAPGGIGCRDPLPSTRAKLAAAKLGKKLSAEHCANISAAQLGRIISPEHCAKLLALSLGREHSAESRAKMAAANLGRKLSPEHRAKLLAAMSTERRAKLLAANLGRKLSAETRAKMSAAHLGKSRKPLSAETRAKISAARLGQKQSPEHIANVLAVKARKRAEREALKQLEATDE